MMRAKRTYEVSLGVPCERWGRSFTYRYGSTSGIALRLSRQSASIEAKMGVEYDADALLSLGNRLFTDAIRKACLLHLVAYSEQLQCDAIHVSIDGTEREAADAAGVARLIAGERLARLVPEGALSDGVASRLLGAKKSSADGLDASLLWAE